MTASETDVKRARRLIYDYQKKRLLAEYSDFGGMDDVIGIFFNHFYPPPEHRPEFEKLKKDFVRTARNPLLKLIAGKWARSRLECIIELDDLTFEMNEAVAREMASGELPGALDDEKYFEFSRRATSRERRQRQLECAVRGFELGIGVVLHFPMNLNQLIKYIPRPLVWNKKLFDLAVETYRVFDNHREDLEGYLAAAKEREAARLDIIFGNEGAKDANG